MAGNKIKNKKNGSSKKQQSPLARVPRQVPRPRIVFDGSVLDGTCYSDVVTTAAFLASGLYTIDFSNTKTLVATKSLQSTGFDLTNLSGRYGRYRYRSCRFTWVPRISPGVADAGTAITIGYIDNPEIMAFRSATASAADQIAFKSVRTLKTFNAWQGFTYVVPLTRRLPWFNINTLLTVSTDEYERSVQGAVVVMYESISAIAQLGQWHISYEADLQGLNTAMST